MGFLSPLFALDLGTHHTRILRVDGKYPAVVIPTKSVRGSDFFSKKSGEDLVSRGRITNEREVSYLIRQALRTQRSGFGSLMPPRVVASVPCAFSEIEKNSLAIALRQAGCLPKLVSKGVAAAVGCGVDMESSRATLLLSCGAGVSELSIILFGSQVFSHETGMTMEAICEALRSNIRQELGFVVANSEIQKLLMRSEPFGDSRKDHDVYGKVKLTGKLEEVRVPHKFLRGACEAFFKKEAESISYALRSLDSAYAPDVIEQGILLYGGLAQLPGLALFLSANLRLPVSVVPQPEDCVMQGLKDIASFLRYDDYEDDETSVLGCSL